MEQIDTNNMYSMVKAFPKLLESAIVDRDIQDICIRLGDEGLGGLSIIGMGGSAIVGQYVQALFQDVSSIPIVTIRDSIIPSFIEKNWSTISVSYSGNTEETLAAFDETVKRGCHSFVIASGGELLSKNGSLGTITIPSGYQPRAAFPLIFSALIQVVECLLGLEKMNLKKSGNILSKRGDEWESSALAPKVMAKDILGSIPLFIGSRHLIPVAYRAKCQINENAKGMAFTSEIPESNHNEIESFNSSNDLPFLPIFLRSAFEDKRISQRFEIVSEIYEEEGYTPIRFSMKSDSRIDEMLLMTFYLDMVSVELAILRGVNPIAVDKISRLKEELGHL